MGRFGLFGFLESYFNDLTLLFKKTFNKLIHFIFINQFICVFFRQLVFYCRNLLDLLLNLFQINSTQKKVNVFVSELGLFILAL